MVAEFNVDSTAECA